MTGAIQAVRDRRRARSAEMWRVFRADRSGLAGLVILVAAVLLALLAPVLTDPAGLDVTRVSGQPLQPPSAQHPLGTDESGRSVLLLTWWGARVSLVVGLSAAVLSVLIGTLVGVCAAHFGGWTSRILLRITDFFLVLPALVLAIALSTVLARGLWTIVLAISVTAWPHTARSTRAGSAGPSCDSASMASAKATASEVPVVRWSETCSGQVSATPALLIRPLPVCSDELPWSSKFGVTTSSTAE